MIASRYALVIAAALATLGCGAEDDATRPQQTPGPPPGYDQAARDELAALGVDRYLGEFTPDRTEERADGSTVHWFDDPNGPTCLYGTPYSTTVRRAGSNKLLIYLQGGGACWSDLCAATERANGGIYPVGWTDDSTPANPLHDHDLVFAAYCDGSVFSGDNELEVPASGGGTKTRYHHGLKNLSAAVSIALRDFPNPDHIVLAGSSAGGYGTLLGTAVVRLAYPDTPLFVFNDAGLGFTNPDDPGILEAASTEWKFLQFMPAGCTACREGRFTSIIGWHLDHDPSLKVGGFTSYADFVIAGAFLGMEDDAFKAMVLQETGIIHDRHPTRFGRYLISGGAHTAMLAGFYDMNINGVPFPGWVKDMVYGGSRFRDVVDATP